MSPAAHLPQLPHLQPLPERSTSYYWSGDTLRSRSVGAVVLAGTVAIPAPPVWLLADWQRQTTQQLELQPGDVAPLSLARARMRWPQYRDCVQAVSDWLCTCVSQDAPQDAVPVDRQAPLPTLPTLLADSPVALMASWGAHYHHDGAQYGGAAFCNLFLGAEPGLEVHFAASGQRIPLVRGTVMVFDTGQPHGLVARGGDGFQVADFGNGQGGCQYFLTWELPIEHTPLAQALGVVFDTDPASAARLTEEQVWHQGAVARLCPQSGRWLAP